jgi:hypothetical protein
LLYFIYFTCIALYQKPKKKIRILGSCFYLSAFSFVKMSNPEVEVRSYNAHHRCAKNHSTMILLRNFYVGISSWNRYVLDTLTGGNFLGTPAGEACTIIESLVGIPPIHVAKTETTLEVVVEKLSSFEKSLPSILENASRVSELIENIGKKITILEASTTLDNQNLRIGKLEESMETLSLIFSSLKFKKEKVFVGKEQKFMYVPKVFVLKSQHALKIGKTLSSTKGDLQVESSSVTFKEPTEVISTSSLDVT